MTAALLGTTGYTGMVLLRLLEGHPEVERILPGSSSKTGEPVSSVDPGFGTSVKCGSHSFLSQDQILAEKPDVVFSCLPHLASAAMCLPFYKKSVIIDLSADFRIPDPDVFYKAYGEQPPVKEFLSGSVYGLVEWHRETIASSDLIAVPGCYPTATLLPLLPAAKHLGSGGNIIVNALSGVSGAGKKAKEMLIFAERSENTCAYSPGRTHRHTPEIQYYLDAHTKETENYTLYFTPHLVPLKRGMEVTTVLTVKDGVKNSDITSVFDEYYGTSPFVRINKAHIPETRETRGSNTCSISWYLDGNQLFLFSCIDNLVKGASGQAVQNMNIRFGFDETLGLPAYGEV
ncbi:MAG: N-acetyl-gamma-glutamyl-phosphate reductase [Spirochaetales bacterium]|nr:N-acetyl-gamma-glutamyl-phosphate reductase [Spirochaetales bacterium]